MRRCVLHVTLLGTVCLWPRTLWAGMPTPQLTDWGLTRLSSISFFAAVFLVAAAVIRALWNVLAKDFTRLPRLSYGKALAGSLLLGLCLVAVLTMIAGARELLTPGAWQRQGPLYAVAHRQRSDASSLRGADPPRTADRKEHLERLRDALWQFAAKHGGRFPSAGDKEITDEAWEVPGGVATRCLYVPGLAITTFPLPSAGEGAMSPLPSAGEGSGVRAWSTSRAFRRPALRAFDQRPD